jgi:hypothetical protein
MIRSSGFSRNTALATAAPPANSIRSSSSWSWRPFAATSIWTQPSSACRRSWHWSAVATGYGAAMSGRGALHVGRVGTRGVAPLLRHPAYRIVGHTPVPVTCLLRVIETVRFGEDTARQRAEMLADMQLESDELDAFLRRALPAPGRGRGVPAAPPPRDPRRRHGPRQDAAGHHRAVRRVARAEPHRLPRVREAELGARDPCGTPGRRSTSSPASPTTRRDAQWVVVNYDILARTSSGCSRCLARHCLRRGALPEEPREPAQPVRPRIVAAAGDPSSTR